MVSFLITCWKANIKAVKLACLLAWPPRIKVRMRSNKGDHSHTISWPHNLVITNKNSSIQNIFFQKNEILKIPNKKSHRRVANLVELGTYIDLNKRCKSSPSLCA